MASTCALSVGIDLGTTNSCVAIFRNGKVDVLQNEEQSYVMPSWVSFTDDRIMVGYEAEDESFKNPKNTIFEVKRLMGQSYNAENVQADIKRFPYEIFNHEGSPKIKVSYQNKEEEYTPQEISAYIIKHLKNLAEEELGQSVTGVVVAVPAYFNDIQRQATKDAAEIAGFKKINVINEPTAAALAVSYQNAKPYDRTVMVYDFGGGTFDVSIVSIGRGKCVVKATKGDPHLGGTDINANLVNFVKEDFKQQFGEEMVESNSIMRRVKKCCEKVKKQLSGKLVVDVELCNLSGHDYLTSITRKQFEELNIDLFHRTLEIVDMCLESSGLPKEAIDEIVMVGGSSRIPKVHELLKEYFQADKINRGVNPDEAVAYGTAVHAVNLLGNKYEVEDVLSISLGLLVLDLKIPGSKLTDKIIPCNTSIPTKLTRRYPTIVDNQESVRIIVQQGEAQLAEENIELGRFLLSGISKAPAGTIKLDVCFEIDFEGILVVTANEVGTGNRNSIKIDVKKKGLTLEQIAKRTAEMERHIQGEKRRKVFISERYKLNVFCTKIIEKAESIEDEKTKAEIVAKCNDISLLLQNATLSSADNLEETREELEKMYRTATGF